MALMEALLKIKAAVEGSGAVDALGRSLGGLGSAAGKVTGGLKGMAGAAGGLAGSMGSLVPLLSAAGLAGLAKSAIDAGDKMYDLSQRTGVSVEMLAKFKKAASLSGTTLEGVTGGLMRLSKAMAAAASSSDFGRTTKEEMEKAKDAVEDGEKEQTRIVKAQADERVKKLEDESDDRLRELNKRYRKEEQLLNDRWDDQADKAERAAEDRTESQVKAIQREYDQKRKAIQTNENISDAERDARLDNLSNAEDRALDIIRNNAADETKLRKRAARDQQQVVTDQLNERKAAEEKAIRDRVEGQKAIIQRGAEDQTLIIKRASEEAVKALKTDPGDSALSDELDELGLTGKGASEAFRQLGISVKNQDGTLRSSSDVMLDVANRFKGMKDGTEKTALAMKLFGKAGAELVPMLNMGGGAIENLSVKMNAAFAEKADLYADKMAILGGKVGGLGADIAIKLLPYLEKLTDNLLKGFDAFSKLDPKVQGLIIGAAGLAASFLVLAPAITAVIGIFGVLGPAIAGLKIGATIAGWAGAIGPAITAITAAFTSLLAWLTGTLVPGLIAIFSGPVGWTVLAVAAVVAMVVLFRKPIMEFFTWLGTAIGTGLNALWKWSEPIRKFWVDAFSTVGNTVKQALSAIGGVLEWAFKAWYAITYQAWVQPWISLWDKVLREPVSKLGVWIKGIWKGITDFFGSNVIKPIQTGWDVLMKALPNAMEKLGDAVKGVWNGIVSTIKNAFRSVLQFIANGINSTGRLVNQLIGAFNKLPGDVDIPMVPTITVPAFAKGGYVGGGTLAMVGEAGPEYIIPEQKMAQASMNYLNGARGGAVIPAYAQGGYVGDAFSRSRKLVADINERSDSIAAGKNPWSRIPPEINIKTGPVMEFNGDQYVTVADLHRAILKARDGIYSSLRTPAGRYAMGVR